jgi:lysophospholipid acyltransferase (LPLAT)-like uncharacterized protein
MVSWIAYVLVNALGRSQRWRVHDEFHFLPVAPSQRFVFAFWHNRLMLMPFVRQRFLPERKLAAMVSASRDGSKLVPLLNRFGVEVVRGSSSRFGPRALRELAEKMQEGFDGAITPDGPRGPRYEAQFGVVNLARLTGAAIVPLSYRLSWKLQLKSWDGFFVPLPFGRCELFVGRPVLVAADADETECERKLREVAAALMELGGEGVTGRQEAKGKRPKQEQEQGQE